MKLPRLVAVSFLVLGSFAATGVTPSKPELETMYDKAFREFDANHYDAALKALDAIDARQPDLAESKNLRGVVLMRKGNYDQAEKALRKALEIEPKFWNASFNLAEIPFLKKDWAEARNRFEALVAGDSEEMKGETSLLIQYKILLTFVLQGKEKMADWIVNKFEGEKESPALYYSNAAIALQHHNEKEAKEWMDAADKHYAAPLNKLFAESFYEIGWLKKPAGETRAAIEITSTAEHAARLKADAQANFERAERAFQQRDLPAALKFLGLADEGVPGQAKSLNLRGEILMEQGKYDEAESAFQKAFSTDPKFREAQYNLAQIPFKKKQYAKSRERLEKLYTETPGGAKNQAAQLIKYKIFMTLLLEGNDAQAQQMMDQFKFTGDTPALYYAQAAWAFKHDKTDKGNDWVKSARKIYSPALNIVFADTFYDLGWLSRATATAPATTALAQANATPVGPAPAMRFGETESIPAPVAAGTQEKPVAAAASTPGVATNPSPAAATSAPVTTKAAAAIAASSPAPVLASPAPNAAKAPAPAIAEATPAVKAAAPSARSANAPATSVAKASVPPTAHSSSAMTPAATALAPARIREYSQPTFAELVDHVSEPQTLLFGGLLLAGVAILGWLVVQQIRRQPGGASLYQSSMPLTEPPFGGPVSADERRLSSEQLDAGPPRLSLKLTASEPAVPQSVFPVSVAGGTKAADELPGASPNEPSETASAVRPVTPPTPPPAAKMPVTPKPAPAPSEPQVALKLLRDEKEVSLAALPKPSPVPPKAATATPPPSVAAPKASVAAPPKPAVRAEVKPPAAEPPKSAVAAEVKPPVAEPPKLAVAAEAKPLATEPQKRSVAAEAKPPIATDGEVLAKREEPVGQGQPVPHLTACAPVAAQAEPPEMTPKQTAPEQRPTRLEPETAAIAAIAGEFAPTPPLPAPTFAAKAIATTTTAPIGNELTAPNSEPAKKPEQAPIRLEPETAAIAGIVDAKPAQSSVETPAIPSKITTTSPTTPPQTPPAIMPEPTPITSINEPRPAPVAGAEGTPSASAPSPATPSASAHPASGFQTAVQLTFSLEIASLQLTPNFKMGSLQLKPISKIVSMRLAPSAQPQPAMNLQVTFELASVQLGPGGSIGTVRLTPSSAQRPTQIATPSFEISGLQLMSDAAASPVQLTPSAQGQASVLMTASFQIATVDFSPSFEIASVVLNSTSKNVAVQLPGAGPSSIEGAPVFEIGSVQLSGNSDLGLIQLNPLGAGRRS